LTYIDFKKGYKFLDKQGQETTAYDTEEKTWCHLNFFQAELKGHKYIFLKNDDKLSKNQIEAKYYFLNQHPKLGEGYRLKELFNDFWDIKDIDDASGYLSYWCDLVIESKIAPFIKAAKTIKSHWSGILNYIKSKLTNGILEGINSKIQLAKKRARGYRNIYNFITMIYFVAGKLKFDYQPYIM
jgi:transposase